MPMRSITVRLTDEQYAWLRLESKRTGKSMSSIVRDAVDWYFSLQPASLQSAQGRTAR
jgi:predicted DNA-binding protein